jgi:hypothetical protein
MRQLQPGCFPDCLGDDRAFTSGQISRSGAQIKQNPNIQPETTLLYILHFPPFPKKS